LPSGDSFARATLRHHPVKAKRSQGSLFLAAAESAHSLCPETVLDIRPMTPLIGAEIAGIDLRRPSRQSPALYKTIPNSRGRRLA
jgi:hypothetical protein